MDTAQSGTKWTAAALVLAASAGACTSSQRADGVAERPAPVAAAPRAAAPSGPMAAPVSMHMTHSEPHVSPDASSVGLLFLDEHASRSSGSHTDTLDNLTQTTFAREGADFDPDISTDGSTLVYASTQHRATADIYVKSVHGQAVTQLTNDPAQDVMPAISPDGQRVAFCSNRAGSWDVFVVGIGGGQPVQITMESTHELHPTWSPDGRNLAFCRLNPRSRQWELWVVEAANPTAARFIGHGLMPEWSPAGDLIAFQKPRDRGERLYSIWTVSFSEGEARNPTEVASDPQVAFVNPTWSPDGTRLAFAAVSNPSGPIVGGLGFKPGSSQIWMVNVDGSGRTPLTDGPFVSVIPKWSPDGRIYFVSNRAGTDNVWSLSPGLAIQTASFDGSSHAPGHGAASHQVAGAGGPGAASHGQPGTNPMKFPGMAPGMTPGMNPGMTPGMAPGMASGHPTQPGQNPTSENHPAGTAQPMMGQPQPAPSEMANAPSHEDDPHQDH